MRYELPYDKRESELQRWRARFEERRAATQDAIDRGARIQDVKRLAFEARSAELNVEDVARHGRILSRAERRRLGVETRLDNGYRPPAC